MNADFVVAKAREVRELEAKLEKAKKELFAAIADKKESKTKKKDGPTRTPLTKLIPNDILIAKKNKDGVTNGEITKQVLSKGYKHTSKDFENVIYQTVRKLVRRGDIVELEVDEGEEPAYVHPQYTEE